MTIRLGSTREEGLMTVQRDHSMLTFENSPTQGAAAIIEKLAVCYRFERASKETDDSLLGTPIWQGSARGRKS